MRNGSEQRPHLRVVQPQSSSGEHVVRNSIIGSVLAGIVAAAAFVRIPDQPYARQLPDTPSISGPAVPGKISAVEEEKQEISADLALFMQVYAAWRNSLPEGTSVNVTFYPEESLEATVISPVGVIMRFGGPSINSRYVTNLPQNSTLGGTSRYDLSRFIVRVDFPNGNSEEWIGRRELAPEYRADNPVRYRQMFFSAIRVGDEQYIRIDKEPENSMTVEWPRTNQ